MHYKFVPYPETSILDHTFFYTDEYVMSVKDHGLRGYISVSLCDAVPNSHLRCLEVLSSA